MINKRQQLNVKLEQNYMSVGITLHNAFKNNQVLVLKIELSILLNTLYVLTDIRACLLYSVNMSKWRPDAPYYKFSD